MLFTRCIFFACIIVVMQSCNTTPSQNDGNDNAAATFNNDSTAAIVQPDSATIISKTQFDSLLLEGKFAQRQNINAMVDGVKFTSTSFTVNDMDLKGATVYAIYATNGAERIIINYRGIPQPGSYDIIKNADAIFMTADNKLYNAVKGSLTFTTFDLNNKTISGTFNFLAKGDDEKRKEINISGGSFSVLEFN